LNETIEEQETKESFNGLRKGPNEKRKSEKDAGEGGERTVVLTREKRVQS